MTASMKIPTGNERILFIDDEALMLELNQQMLAELNYQVTAVDNCREAMDLFSKGADEFDLIITDQVMPKMTGLELAEKLLTIRSDIPIILCSGVCEDFSQECLNQSGICSLLSKPYSITQIANAVRAALDHQ